MATRVVRAASGSVRDKTISVLGVTFKPNTDDMREAPSLTIIPILLGEGARIRVYDPQGRRNGEALLPDVTWCACALEAAEGADVVLVLTEWNEFRAIDLEGLRRVMGGDLLVDTRNVFRPEEARSAGLRYIGIGRPNAVAPTPNGAAPVDGGRQPTTDAGVPKHTSTAHA
jgi:UDPglucose 6-dehydrogenase